MLPIERQLAAYMPCCEQEERDRDVMLRVLWSGTDAFSRENLLAHFTASAWIVDEARAHVLMAWHNIFRAWSWTGGHADGETDLLSVAVREAREETGLCRVEPVFPDIFSLETLTVDGHEKRGVYVPSHRHLNVTYLLRADHMDMLRAKPDENSGVRWFSLDGAVAASSEEWMRSRVYEKLNRKFRALGTQGTHAQ